jgi:hypothetical protein
MKRRLDQLDSVLGADWVYGPLAFDYLGRRFKMVE